MGRLNELLTDCLRDRRITDDEVAAIRQYVQEDGQLDLADVRFLVELLSESQEVCPAFDELFFPLLKKVVLRDGQVGMDEQFYLLKMLYSDGEVRQRELDFLAELRNEAAKTSPEFETLYETAMSCPAKQWDLGGATSAR